MSEVASFVAPLSQFEAGHSAYECCAYGAADIYYCGRPGAAPAGTAAQVASTAQTWYAKLEGSNGPGNTNGMSLEALYTMLKGIGLQYNPAAVSIDGVKTWLNKGIPVLICGAEASFFDIKLGRVPYSWVPSGNHCIVASGTTPLGNLIVHDYANVLVTAGSAREYDAKKMKLVSATAVIPRWYTPPEVETFTKEETDCWNAVRTDCPTTTGIARAWSKAWRAGHLFGPPLSKEYNSVNGTGEAIIAQEFAHARCEDRQGIHVFYDGRGAIGAW